MESENKNSLSNNLRTGEFFIADEEMVKAPWFGMPNGEWFKCGFCGHKFKVGDKLRWIYTNDIPGAPGNPLACMYCCYTYKQPQVEHLREVWKEMSEKVRKKYWWFVR